MKQEHIIDALNLLNDDILEETNRLRCQNRKPYRMWKWVATAACSALILFAIGKFAGNSSSVQKTKNPVQKETIAQDPIEPIQSEEASQESQDLPMITVTEHSGMDNGFECVMAYDISEIVDGNPWNENTKLSTLPVYKNSLEYYHYYLVKNADHNAMKSFLLSLTERFGMDEFAMEEETSISDENDAPKGYFMPTTVIAENKDIRIEVDTTLTATISLEPAITLPKEYHFRFYASYEDKKKVAKYLQETYRDWIAIENPMVNIHGGDYDYDLNQKYDIEFFDGSGDITKQIINYNFNRIAFYCDNNGKLDLVRIFKPDLSGKAGDYPIISTEKARKLLSKGHYITTVPDDMPGEEYIAKTELVYRTGNYEEYYMPYYRFLVELPDTDTIVSEGIKTYGAYYVPAVEKAYISNMPLWNGNFN